MTFRKLGILCAVAMSFTLGACSSKYRTDSHQLIQTAAPGSSFYIMEPQDGVFGHITYEGSGKMLSNEVQKQLAPYSQEIVKATEVENREQAFANAQSQNLDYLIDPQIMHWEDRATEWSGRPDRITIQYQAFDVNSKALLANTTLSASSKWATLGGDHPVDLLPQPTSNFIAVLLGKSLDIDN